METRVIGKILKLPLFNAAMSTSQKAVDIQKIKGKRNIIASQAMWCYDASSDTVFGTIFFRYLKLILFKYFFSCAVQC